MKNSGGTKFAPKPLIRPEYLHRYLAGAWIIWTMLVAASVFDNLRDGRLSTIQLAAAEARATYNKDLVYRRWATMHGGVYVPVTDTTPPNPYLHVPNRDVTTESGLHLTLMNPAYMTRQVFEISPDQYGTRGHITGLNPINPGNAPDAWEATALRRFDEGETEVHEITLHESVRFMRLMRPFRVEAGCRKCHDEPLGSLRGGISISVPMRFYDDLYIEHATRTVGFHIVIWLFGCVGIFGMQQSLKRQIESWAKASEVIQRSEFELRQAAEDLAESAARHRIVSENVSDLITEFDATGRVLFVNDRHKELLGYEPNDLVGKEAVQFIHPDDRERALQLIRRVVEDPGRRLSSVLRLMQRDGESLWVECTGICAVQSDGHPRIYVASRDVTEQRRHQEELLVSSRLAAIGSLAAGVAHEFNNLLTIQKNNATLLLMDRDRYGLSDAAARCLHYIVESVDRGAEIVKSLSGIAQPKDPMRISFDVVAVLEHFLRVQARSLEGDRIRVEKRWAAASIGVYADRGQIEQVLINVVQNAVHAMIPRGGGQLTLEVRNAGPEVKIEIADTGIGMDEETRARIFDPFFTTKGSHARDAHGIPGTGLGLSISQKLVLENNGRIEVTSAPGCGTSIIIHLPRARADSPFAVTASREEAKPGAENGLDLMIVEDDAAQRESLVHLLAHLGFASAIAFERGQDALTAARSRAPAIVLLDYIMPEMNGAEVMRELRRISPAIRIVVMTGSVNLTFAPGEIPDAVLQKPINFDELTRCLKQLKEAIARNKP